MSTTSAPASAGRVFAKAAGTEASQVGQEFVVLDAEGRVVRGLNRVGARIWTLIDGSRTLTDIAACLAEEFKISQEQALGDVAPFVNKLADRKLLTPKDR